jgi:hypothetical protein
LGHEQTHEQTAYDGQDRELPAKPHAITLDTPVPKVASQYAIAVVLDSVGDGPPDANSHRRWYTAAFTHHTRVEDYPVMTRETVGFSLQPDGFFDQNAALDAP